MSLTKIECIATIFEAYLENRYYYDVVEKYQGIKYCIKINTEEDFIIIVKILRKSFDLPQKIVRYARELTYLTKQDYLIHYDHGKDRLKIEMCNTFAFEDLIKLVLKDDYINLSKALRMI